MMETKNVEIKLPEGKFHTQLQFFDESDKKTIRNMYDNWVTLSDELQQYGGRRINLPEIISEAIFCLNFNAGKKTKSIGSANSSFDCYDLKRQKRIQVKASSVKFDLTSFGPKSQWDEIYFIHLFPNNKYDGAYKIYLIPSALIYNHKVNANQTMKDQQKIGKRPRFGIMKEIVLKQGIEAIVEGNL